VGATQKGCTLRPKVKKEGGLLVRPALNHLPARECAEQNEYDDDDQNDQKNAHEVLPPARLF
jgi:hypothetical protein